MTTAFTRDNAAVIRSRGHPVTPGNLYLAHFLGVGGALKALSGNRNTQISNVFGEHHVRANPFERGKSIGWLIGWAAKKMTGRTPSLVAKPSQQKAAQVAAQKQNGNPDQAKAPAASAAAISGEPMVKYATDSAFAELKRAVEVMLR
jgi:hypothetical protein